MANPFEVAPVNALQALLMQGQGMDAGFKPIQQRMAMQEQIGKMRARDQLSQMLQGGEAPDYGKLAIGMLASGDTAGAGVLANLVNQQASRDMEARRLKIAEDAAQRAGVPAGFDRAPAGGLTPIPGGPADPAYKRAVGDRQNAPPGYKWREPNNPDAGLVPIPGGPGEKVDAEVAARIGLGRSFLGQLPEIKEAVKRGDATGPIDFAEAKLGRGRAGELHRQIASGAEALLRNLTGAGMNKEEANEYVNRYRPSWRDDATTLLSKLDQLERELNSVMETVGRGRGGMPGIPGGAAPATPQASSGQFREGMTATNPQTGEKRIFRGGQWVPVQ